ncbi:YceI family protein [Rhizobium rhizogenes]|uniref:YceI family protein n=1 Tax=Rhizobium rhizogenes TaxID=359 RepID=UPI001571DEE6|nr:YceI family protein [Rhizobium rhizogenes]NTF44614.1 polyisoprenoid-binding protein [Rhizobium rhizogenes]
MNKKFALALFAFSSLAAPAFAADYAIDPTHTHVAFKIDHVGFSHVLGYFATVAGTLSFDPANAGASKLNVTIQAESLNTNFAQRDTDLKGADWLDTAEFSTITYVGKTFTKTDDTHGTIAGDLTIRGVAKPVTLNVTLNKIGVHPMTKDEAVGFDATATFKRSDFGIKTYLPYIGDDITVDISTEAHAAK